MIYTRVVVTGPQKNSLESMRVRRKRRRVAKYAGKNRSSYIFRFPLCTLTTLANITHQLMLYSDIINLMKRRKSRICILGETRCFVNSWLVIFKTHTYTQARIVLLLQPVPLSIFQSEGDERKLSRCLSSSSRLSKYRGR